MESLDRAHARAQQRLDPRVLEPARAETMADIRALVTEFDPNKNVVHGVIPLMTNMEGSDSDGNKRTFQVSAETRSKSKREMLIEGLDVVKRRIEAEQKIAESGEAVKVNGRSMRPPNIGSGIHSHSWVDPLIKQWLGGRRDGLMIVWDLADGYRYEYDVYEHKLSRVSFDEVQSN